MMAVISRLKLEAFATFVKKQPNNIKELAEFLNKYFGNSSRDVKVLELNGLSELKKNKSDKRELRSIAKYSQLAFDFKSTNLRGA